MNETTIRLGIIAERYLLPPEKIVAIVAENRELCRIIAASITKTQKIPSFAL